ncbi:DUF4351 domain-containing protein [Humisphaera borealis]|uniref:DUF4351 domain-containing protein n=1 Tax=Humisphaera borealis TaxID=2807512 RepID=A0A7M2X462_9BACT|nr:DUF4351 domain-containing protein [Humisphaera borealis]
MVRFDAVDHDRLFKQLLRTFFIEFLDLFLPQVTQYLEPGSLEFLDKEVFTDLSAGERHEVDLVTKCRFRGENAFFLIHVETQSGAQSDFAARMFRYFARLTEQHAMPVYPIGLFTYDAPARPEPDAFQVRFPDLDVVLFRFRAIQLNRLNWRDYMRQANPVAAALMSKMQIAAEDRPKVKLECLRLMATLKLDKSRQALIRDFMDSYLRLSTAEMQVYDRELQAIASPEREVVMQIVNEWEARGEARGIVTLLTAQISHRFGEVPGDLLDRIAHLSKENLQSLALALFDLDSMSDVEEWIATHH